MTQPLRIRAAVLHDVRTPLVVEEVLLDPPGVGEVLVSVVAAGVCHSDLHLAEGHLGGRRWPTVLGHEGAGVIEAVGERVDNVAPGDRVALCFIPSCGRCRACLDGHGNLCENGPAAVFRGTMLDGTRRLYLDSGEPLKHFLGVACFAEKCVVPAASAVRIPSALPLWQAALVGCGVVTGFGAVRNAARVRTGESVCVVGCGGIGLNVIAAARLAGAEPVIAVDLLPEKLERALARGAMHAVDAASEGAVETVRELAGGGVDHAIEAVGRAESIRFAWSILRRGGTATVVGIAPVGVEVSVPAIEFLDEKSLRGSFYGSGNPAREIAELAELVASGRLDLARSVSHFTGLEGINAAFDRLRRGVGARTVVILDAGQAEAPGGL